MPTILNATTTSGITISPDNSGVLELRSNGVQGASGTMVLGTAVTASGTAVDFNSIPSWAKRIVVMFSGVSTNGTSIIQVQLGDSGGVETTGYLGGVYTSNTVNANLTNGFLLRANAVAAADLYHGSLTLSLLEFSTNTWVCQGIVNRSNAADNCFVGGSKALSATLDRVRITTVNGTDTFDAGKINIQYEG
jgi:hypothetical protein